MSKFFRESGFAEVLKKEIEKRQLKKTPMRFLGFKKEAGESWAEFAIYDPRGFTSKACLSNSECETLAKDSGNPDSNVAASTLQQWPAD